MTVDTEETQILTRKILGEEHVLLDVSSLEISQTATDMCDVKVTLKGYGALSGSGVGHVDAVFNALKCYFSPEFESLKTIEMFNFNVEVDKSDSRHRDKLDSLCTVTFSIKNSYGTKFSFVDSSRSLMLSSANCVAEGLAYFINSEKAYIVLHSALRDAKSRHRPDLVSRYISEMARLVKSTSYTEVIDKITQEANI